MKLVVPSLAELPQYADALRRGWSPDNVRLEAAAREELDRIAADPAVFVASLDDLDLFSDDQDDLAATVLANTNALAYDPEGRVILPKNLLDHAELGDEAVFVGRGSRFQIWSPALFETHNARAFERARSRGATLALRNTDKIEP